MYSYLGFLGTPIDLSLKSLQPHQKWPPYYVQILLKLNFFRLMMYICGDIRRPKIIHQNWGFLFRLPRIILSTITIESNWNVWHPLPTFIGRVLKLLFYKKSQNLPQLWLLVMMFKLKKQVNFKELSKRNFIDETNHRSVNYISINYTIVVDRVPEIQC